MEVERMQSNAFDSAAKEFFTEAHNWKTLPPRIETLCGILQNGMTDYDETSFIASFADTPEEACRLSVTASIMVQAHRNPSFYLAFHKLLRHSLTSRQEMDDENLQDDDDGEEALNMEQIMFRNLQTLGWIRRQGFLHEALEDAVQKTVLEWVRAAIATEYEEECLFQGVQEYKDMIVGPWLTELMGAEDYIADSWDARLSLCIAQCFCLVRMDEIFEIVAEYPDSYPAVIELRSILEQTDMHQELGEALRDGLVRRLNHPGANTNQIIDVYINTIKVLREIDPSDRLLRCVAEPVRSYLRCRNDTVRCIITSLTDAEAGGDLYEELRRHDAQPLEHINEDSDDEEECPGFDWQPPPPISQATGSFWGIGSKGGGGGDILSMLVSIYGSKEMFVDEYRLMLADKLLTNLDSNTDKEVHTLELLKLRFGEVSMRNCEIMIKDMDDSKRINTNIRETVKSNKFQKDKAEPVVDAAIVSHIFWPALQKEVMKHHPRIQADLDQFSNAYARLKNPRRLNWLNQLGNVELELDVVETDAQGYHVVETKEFTCTPMLATIISYFEDKPCWTIEDLALETGIPEHIIERKIGFWTNKRVIRPVPSKQNEYELASQEYLLQDIKSSEGGFDFLMSEDGSDERAVSASAQEEEAMDVYESYIVGMLSNLGQLPLDRIHNMLKTFVTGSDVKYNKTPQQLAMFLQHLCKQGRLECGPDGTYKLLKK